MNRRHEFKKANHSCIRKVETICVSLYTLRITTKRKMSVFTYITPTQEQLEVTDDTSFLTIPQSTKEV